MATLVEQVIDRDGLDPLPYAAASGGGDDFANTGIQFIHVKNGDSSPHTVTVVTPAEVDGLEVADREIAVPAGEERFIGPFPTSWYGLTTQLTYDAVTAVTLALLRVGT